VVSLRIFSVVPPTEPCALRSTQLLKVSTRDFSWGKGGRCVWLTTYHHCSTETSRKSGALTYPEHLGPPRPVAGHLYLLILYHHVFGQTFGYHADQKNVVSGPRLEPTNVQIRSKSASQWTATVCHSHF